MKRIALAVDDALTMRKLVSFTLRSVGFEVLEAQDGLAALDVLRAQPVDLIITDVNMPRLNGLDFTRQARQLPHGRTVPILVLTTESDTEKKNQARAAGATAWIVKPFQQPQLLALVGRVIPGSVPSVP